MQCFGDIKFAEIWKIYLDEQLAFNQHIECLEYTIDIRMYFEPFYSFSGSIEGTCDEYRIATSKHIAAVSAEIKKTT